MKIKTSYLFIRIPKELYIFNIYSEIDIRADLANEYEYEYLSFLENEYEYEYECIFEYIRL